MNVTVPVNLPAIHWVPGYSLGEPTADPANLTLATTATPSTPIPFTATAQPDGSYLLVPNQALVMGTTYTITDASSCGISPGPTVLSQFTTAASAPLPTVLGVVTPYPMDVSTLSVPTSSGSCTSTVWADQATFDLALSADAIPWTHALLYTTVVDGNVLHGAHGAGIPTFNGDDIDRIYHVCASDDPGASTGLTAGVHEFLVRVSLPGVATTLESTPVSTTLQCDADPPPSVCTEYPALCEDDSIIDPGTGGDEEETGCCSSTAPAPSSLLIALCVALLLVRSRSSRRRPSAP